MPQLSPWWRANPGPEWPVIDRRGVFAAAGKERDKAGADKGAELRCAKARKNHKCSVCGETIGAGMEYMAGGSWRAHITCAGRGA